MNKLTSAILRELSKEQEGQQGKARPKWAEAINRALGLETAKKS
jgi:hypothetical protein